MFAHAVGLNEFGVARCGDFGEMGVGFRSVEIGAGLGELLIHFRCVDVREQSALLDAAADVVIPLLQIPAGARVNGGFHIGLQGSGEDKVFLRRFRGRMNDGDRGNRKGFRFLGQGLILRAALEQRESAKDDQQNHKEEKEGENPPAFAVLRLLMFRIHRNTASHHGPNDP